MLDGDQCEENTYSKDYNHRKSRKYYVESDGELLDTDVGMDRDRYHGHTRNSSRQENRDHKNKTYETESHGHLLDRGQNRVIEHGSTRTSSSQQRKAGAQDDYGDCEKKVHEFDGDWSTRDKDRDSYRDSRRSSGHKRKVGYADNHKDRKSRAHDSDGEWSDSNKKGDEHHSVRKSSGHSGNASKCLKQGESSTRSCTAELSEDSLEKDAEKDTIHARKRSKRWDKVSDKSDGDRAPAQGLRHCADRSSLQVKEVDSPVKQLRSDGTPESSSLDQHDLRCISDVHIDKQDRWEPEPGSAEIYHSSKGKAGSSECYESGRPGQYNERDESSEFDSKLYYDDEVGKADHYESGEVTCSKNRKSRQKSRKNDGDGDGDNRKRSRGSSQSGYWRYSNSSDVATDSSEDNKECRRHKKHRASHRSRDHKRHP